MLYILEMCLFNIFMTHINLMFLVFPIYAHNILINLMNQKISLFATLLTIDKFEN